MKYHTAHTTPAPASGVNTVGAFATPIATGACGAATPTHTLRASSRRHSSTRERGSLLILCVTVLVIIALIGIAFLQRVRMDQAATARHERSYINLVINGILGEVSGQMEVDVKENQSKGNLLYDYPWTDHTEREYWATQEYTTPAAARVRVNGYDYENLTPVKAPQDDRWLASTAPVWNLNGGAFHWLHLTNLTGIWLDLPDGSGASARENLINGNNAQIGVATRSDTDLSLSTDAIGGLAFARPGGYQRRGTDADGDGILDAMWQWTPVSVRNLGGKKYVMALRIVDLNSMLNVNTAASLTYNGNPGTPIVARGHNPSWVDLSRLFARTRPAFYNQARDWKDELSEILALRLSHTTLPSNNFNVAGGAIFETTRDGRIMWEEQGSIYGNTDRNYLMDTEMELRRFGGLNDRSLTSTLEKNMGQANNTTTSPSYLAGEKLSRVLRQHPDISDDASTIIGAEGSYLNVVNPANTLSPNESINRWFYGDDGTPTNDGDSLDVKDREFPAIRHMLTAASGIGSYAVMPDVPPPGTRSDLLKFDLNRDWDELPADLDRELENLTDLMSATFKRTSGNYLNLPDGDIDALIEDYVIAIKDYSDADNVPTEHPAAPGVYGMERLPFLREVYVQALYADVLGDINNRAPWDAGYDNMNIGTNYVGWSPDIADVGGETYALAIEIGNPFNHLIYGPDPIPADGIDQGLDGWVEVRVYQGATELGRWEFGQNGPSSFAAIEPRSTGNDDTLVIYSPPIDEIDEHTNTYDGSTLDTDLNIPADAQRLELPPGQLTNGFTPGGAPIEVELWVRTKPTLAYRKYDSIVLNGAASLPTNIDRPAPVANPGPEHQFAQASSARDSEDINYVVDDGLGSTDSNVNLPSPGGNYSANTDRFGNDVKVNGIAFLVDQRFFQSLQLHLPDQPMRSVSELGLVHMFGFTNAHTFSKRMSTNFTPVLEEGEHFLLVNPDQRLYDVMPGVGIPHVAQLMDMVTTVSPSDNGKDNDNNDGDNRPDTIRTSPPSPLELFIPGMINVNTAPLHIMTLGSPLGETLDEAEKLMRTLVAYRDEPLRGNRTLMGQDHGQYWSNTVAGFDVRDIRDNAINPDYHVRDFPNTASSDRLNRPGIASLGELLSLNPGNPDNDMLRYGIDGTPGLPVGNGGMDMHPDPNDLADANSPTVLDDNEQFLARFGMLSQAYTVRSDRFVVYGVVQGYDDNELKGLPVETARFIAVIDRGSMDTSAAGIAAGLDKPRVIGFVRLQ